MIQESVKDVFGKKPGERPVGDTPLDVWLRARDISRFTFAKDLGVAPRTVQLWCNNQVLPDLVNSFRIQRATEGGVTPEMWLGTDLAKFMWEHSRSDWANRRTQVRKANRKHYLKRTGREEGNL